MQSVTSFRPEVSLDDSVAVGPVRGAVFSRLWEDRFSTPVPAHAFRSVLEPPAPSERACRVTRPTLANTQILPFPMRFGILICQLHFPKVVDPIHPGRGMQREQFVVSAPRQCQPQIRQGFVIEEQSELSGRFGRQGDLC